LNCSNLKKIIAIVAPIDTQSAITILHRRIVLQIAITGGEAMKIAKFFRFLRTFKHPE
jgi:hypothetical protein